MGTALNIVKKFFPGVTDVQDAKTEMHIEVTPHDSKESTKKNHNHCAMAVACKREFKLDGVIISSTTAYLIKGKKATRYKLPESVSREVVSFDRNGGFEPGEYQLSAPSPTHRIGQYRGDSTHTGKGSKQKFQHATSNIRTALRNKQ